MEESRIAKELRGIFAPDQKGDSSQDTTASDHKGDVDKYIKFGNGDRVWRVLAVAGDKALIITKDIVIDEPYSRGSKEVTWRISGIRAWLNKEFCSFAYFSKEERARIVKVPVLNYRCWKHGTKDWPSTRDKIFLLSRGEVQGVLQNRHKRKTAMAGSSISGKWWLRSSGKCNSAAEVVLADGSIEGDEQNPPTNPSRSYTVDIGDPCGVRPALWLKITNEFEPFEITAQANGANANL